MIVLKSTRWERWYLLIIIVLGFGILLSSIYYLSKLYTFQEKVTVSSTIPILQPRSVNTALFLNELKKMSGINNQLIDRFHTPNKRIKHIEIQFTERATNPYSKQLDDKGEIFVGVSIIQLSSKVAIEIALSKQAQEMMTQDSKQYISNMIWDAALILTNASYRSTRKGETAFDQNVWPNIITQIYE